MSNVQFALETSVAVKHSDASIRPFVSGRPNFGLERYNMVVADGCRHRVGISVMGIDRIKTYITGLNELSSDMQKLKELGKTDKEKKEEYEAKVLEIRRIVARAERELTANYKVNPDTVTVDDAEFWQNVLTFSSVVPDKFDEKGVRIPTYWDDIFLELDNHGHVLDARNISDLLLIKAIEAGGFALIAPSYEEAVESGRYKFYLDKRVASSKVKVSGRKTRDQAASELLKLSKDFNKMFYVTKLVSLDSMYYKSGGNVTPGDVLYDDCGKFLDGEGSIKSKEKAAEKFLEVCKMDMEELRLRCMVQDGSASRYISYKADGIMYYLKSNAPIGKTVADAISYLKDPNNADVYKQLAEQCNKDWAGA